MEISLSNDLLWLLLLPFIVWPVAAILAFVYLREAAGREQGQEVRPHPPG